MVNSSLDGIIPINKPKGMTSHTVVAKLRRILGTKKVGHTGTLDPDVSGVLPICIGKATRLSDYIMELPKTYLGQVTLGISTTTQDASGEVIEQRAVEGLSEEIIADTFKSFIGEIEQIPPMYSAVKVKGKKLYEIARQGKEIERKARVVTIYELEILEIYIGKEYPTVDFSVTCSKGTYVRTLCADIGSKLGYPAHMSNLIRIKSGNFPLEKSYTLEEVETVAGNGNIENILVSMREALPQFDEIVVADDRMIDNIYNGQTIYLDSMQNSSKIVKVADNSGNLIALYQKITDVNRFKPVKVFK